MSMLINFSVDPIYIKVDNLNKITIENKNIEKNFSEALNSITKIDDNYIKNIITINWPWSFTAIRTATLALNLLNYIKSDSLNFWDISKIDLYKLFYNLKLIPKIWIIFIWQKKNVWKVDFSNNNIEKISIEDIIKINEYFFNDLLLENNSNYSEEIKEKLVENHFEIDLKEWKVLWIYKWINKSIDYKTLECKKSLIANYMIEPNIQ